MSSWLKGVFTLRFSYRKGQCEWNIGWFWVGLTIALIIWGPG